MKWTIDNLDILQGQPPQYKSTFELKQYREYWLLSASCGNNIQVRVSNKYPHKTIGSVFSTLQRCPDKICEFENYVIDIFKNIENIEIQGGRLNIKSKTNITIGGP